MAHQEVPITDTADATAHPRPLLRRPWTPLDGEWASTADPDLGHERPDGPAFAAR